jgi:hypothetical protein
MTLPADFCLTTFPASLGTSKGNLPNYSTCILQSFRRRTIQIDQKTSILLLMNTCDRTITPSLGKT